MSSPQFAGAWFVVLITTAAQMVVAMANIVLPTIAPKIAETLGVEPVLVGYHVGLTFAAATLASLYAGLLVPRWGAALMTQLSMAFCVVGLALFALPHIAFVAAGSIAVGAGMGFTAPSAAHLLVEHTSPERRNLMFSIKQTGVPFGGVVVSLAAPVLAVTVGWQWALVMIGVFALATLAATEFARAAWDSDRRPAGSVPSAPFGGVPLVWQRPSLRWVSLAAVLFAGVQRMLLSFTVVYLVAEGGYGLVEAGVMLSVAQVGGSVARIPWGWLADRLKSGLAVLTVICVMMIATSAALVALDASWPRPLVYLLFLLLGVSCLGWNGIVHAECARLSPPGMVSLVAGGTSFFVFGGITIGPPAFALLYESTGSYSRTFWLMVVCAAAALAFLLVTRRAPK